MGTPIVTSYPFDVELAVVAPHLPTLDYADVAAARAMSRGFVDMLPPVDLTGLTRREVSIPVSGGASVVVRVTTPEAGERPLPVVYNIHGGGFVVGSAQEMEGTDALRAREVGAVVVTVDYRLAPEHPYPTPLEDCYAGLRWLVDNAHDLGVDTERIAVYGQSAGGGLAAALVLLARDRSGPSVSFQYLAFPELDDRLETPSMHNVELHLFPGTFHFSRAISTAQVSQREAAEDVAVLHRALHGPPAASVPSA